MIKRIESSKPMNLLQRLTDCLNDQAANYTFSVDRTTV